MISIDTAHGHSMYVIEAAKKVKRKFPEMELIVGNIATGEAAKALAKVGADAVKVGVGPRQYLYNPHSCRNRVSLNCRPCGNQQKH